MDIKQRRKEHPEQYKKQKQPVILIVASNKVEHGNFWDEVRKTVGGDDIDFSNLPAGHSHWTNQIIGNETRWVDVSRKWAKEKAQKVKLKYPQLTVKIIPFEGYQI